METPAKPGKPGNCPSVLNLVMIGPGGVFGRPWSQYANAKLKVTNLT